MGFFDLLKRAGPVLDIASGGDEGAIPLTPDEMKELKGKLERVVKSSPDKKKQLRAARTLELLRFVEEFGDSISERSDARNALFAEPGTRFTKIEAAAAEMPLVK